MFLTQCAPAPVSPAQGSDPQRVTGPGQAVAAKGRRWLVTPHLFPKGMSVTMMSTEPVRRGRLQMSHWMMSKGMPGEVLLQVQRRSPHPGLTETTVIVRSSTTANAESNVSAHSALISRQNHGKQKPLVLSSPLLVLTFLQQRTDVVGCSLHGLWVVVTSNMVAAGPLCSSLG